MIDLIISNLNDNHNQIDFQAISKIHRKKEYWIGLTKRQKGSMVNIGALKGIELNNLFKTSSLIPDLLVDSYFTINTYFQTFDTYSNYNLPQFYRAEKNLQYLNCCYADLDVGRTEIDYPDKPEKWLSWEDTAISVLNLMELGDLPQASMIARSGRGLYLLWFINDENNPLLPVRAWPNELRLYKQVNEQIFLELKNLGADRIKDGARLLRIPGSKHTKSNQNVKYVPLYDKEGNLYSYSLKELALFFGLKPLKNSAYKFPVYVDKFSYCDDIKTVSKYTRKTKSKGLYPNRRKGQLALYDKRKHDLYKIEEWKKGIPHGFRRKTLKTLAYWCRGLGLSEKETKQELERMAKNCNPPYPSEGNDTPIPEIIKDVFRKKNNFQNWSNNSLLKLYGVDEEIAEDIGLLTIIPESLKQKRIEKLKKRPSNRDIKKEARRKALGKIVKENGVNYGSRNFVSVLYKKYKIKSNMVTVINDLRDMGFVIPKQGRPRKQIPLSRNNLAKSA